MSNDHTVDPATALQGRLIRFAGSAYTVATEKDLIKAQAMTHWTADVGLQKRFALAADYVKHILETKGLTNE